MEVNVDDIPVMYVLSENGPIGASEAFKKLEDAINWQLKGRRFYGVMNANGEYKACLALLDKNEAKVLGFPTDIIPGGKYLRSKIADWEKHVAEIKPAFDKLIKEAGGELDSSRPFVEFYRSQVELLIHVPIK